MESNILNYMNQVTVTKLSEVWKGILKALILNLIAVNCIALLKKNNINLNSLKTVLAISCLLKGSEVEHSYNISNCAIMSEEGLARFDLTAEVLV